MGEEEFYKKLRHNFFGTEDSEDFKELVKAYNDKSKKLELYKTITKEVREYIEEHTENIDRGKYYEDYVETYPILEILDKGSDKE